MKTGDIETAVNGRAFILNFEEPVQIFDANKNPELATYREVVQFGTMTKTACAMEGNDTDATESSLGIFPHPRQCEPIF
jgi:hypothetical protein